MEILKVIIASLLSALLLFIIAKMIGHKITIFSKIIATFASPMLCRDRNYLC